MLASPPGRWLTACDGARSLAPLWLLFSRVPSLERETFTDDEDKNATTFSSGGAKIVIIVTNDPG